MQKSSYKTHWNVKTMVFMAVIDDFEGSEKYEVSICEQNLAKTAEEISYITE